MASTSRVGTKMNTTIISVLDVDFGDQTQVFTIWWQAFYPQSPQPQSLYLINYYKGVAKPGDSYRLGSAASHSYTLTPVLITFNGGTPRIIKY